MTNTHQPGQRVPVRLAQPRIEPIDFNHASDELRAIADRFGLPRPMLNIFATLGRSPQALAAFLSWGTYVLSPNNSLPPREREIVILRVGVGCRSGYEFTQHWQIGLMSGLTVPELERIRDGGPDDWTGADAALIRAADEIVADQFISDATWAALKAHFSEQQLMDVVFTAAQYVQVSIMLNCFGVQIEGAAA